MLPSGSKPADPSGLGALRISEHIALADVARPPMVVRRLVAELLGSHMPEKVDDVALVATELVTNAERHGGGSTHAIVARYEHGATISVTDRHGDCKHIRRGMERMSAGGELSAEGGRGLCIVDQLSTHWVVTSATPAGVTVTATFAPGEA